MVVTTFFPFPAADGDGVVLKNSAGGGAPPEYGGGEDIPTTITTETDMLEKRRKRETVERFRLSSAEVFDGRGV